MPWLVTAMANRQLGVLGFSFGWNASCQSKHKKQMYDDILSDTEQFNHHELPFSTL